MIKQIIEVIGNGLMITHIEFVESVFAASRSEDHCVLRRPDGDFTVVVALSLGAITPTNEENALDVAFLHTLDHLISYGHDRVVPESHGNGLVLFDVVCMEPVHLKGLLDDRRVVLLASCVTDMVHTLVADLICRVDVVFVGLAGLDDAVRCHDDRAWELGKFKLLELPCAAVVASKVGVLLQAWVAMGGELHKSENASMQNSG